MSSSPSSSSDQAAQVPDWALVPANPANPVQDPNRALGPADPTPGSDRALVLANRPLEVAIQALGLVNQAQSNAIQAEGPLSPTELARRAVPWYDQVRNVPEWQLAQRFIGVPVDALPIPKPDHFNAMRVIHRDAQRNRLTPDEAQQEEDFSKIMRRSRDFSVNYCGDTSNDRNHSANITEDKNVALWITCLPANCNVTMLLGAVAKLGKTGKVFATHINEPNLWDNQISSAAKVVFYTREGADRLMDAIRGARLRVEGRTPRAVWNRIKSAARPAEENHRSRVLIIEGPVEIVNEAHLERYFKNLFKFETERVIQRCFNARLGINVLEWRFGSYRSQAEAARIAITKELSGHRVKWAYGVDPCDV